MRACCAPCVFGVCVCALVLWCSRSHNTSPPTVPLPVPERVPGLPLPLPRIDPSRAAAYRERRSISALRRAGAVTAPVGPRPSEGFGGPLAGSHTGDQWAEGIRVLSATNYSQRASSRSRHRGHSSNERGALGPTSSAGAGASVGGVGSGREDPRYVSGLRQVLGAGYVEAGVVTRSGSSGWQGAAAPTADPQHDVRFSGRQPTERFVSVGTEEASE
jgi:hypothetical protein